jgi:hypothetical protein
MMAIQLCEYIKNKLNNQAGNLMHDIGENGV